MATDTYKTDLEDPTRALLTNLESRNTAYTYADYVDLCRQYSDLNSRLSECIDCAQYLGEQIDAQDWSLITSTLEIVKRRLVAIEQDEAIYTSVLAKAYAEARPKLDELEIVSIFMTVEAVDFTDPQIRPVLMLLRGFAKKADIYETVIFNAPLWVIRWMSQVNEGRNITIYAAYNQIHDNAVLEIANALWSPFAEWDCDLTIYSDPLIVLTAAEQLACMA